MPHTEDDRLTADSNLPDWMTQRRPPRDPARRTQRARYTTLRGLFVDARDNLNKAKHIADTMNEPDGNYPKSDVERLGRIAGRIRTARALLDAASDNVDAFLNDARRAER